MIIILITIYILSCLGVYFYTRIAHYHKDGICSSIEPDFGDFLFTVIPFVNTAWAVVCWLLFWPYKRVHVVKRQGKNKIAKFFKIGIKNK